MNKYKYYPNTEIFRKIYPDNQLKNGKIAIPVPMTHEEMMSAHLAAQAKVEEEIIYALEKHNISITNRTVTKLADKMYEIMNTKGDCTADEACKLLKQEGGFNAGWKKWFK
jgi:hypothetical protein